MGLLNLDTTNKDDENNEDEDDDGDDNAEGDPLRTPAATSAVLPAFSASHGQKCKAIADSITEVSASERDNHIKISKINTTAKTDHATQWESIKWQSYMDMKLPCMQHQQEETAAQRAHEATMFNRQAGPSWSRRVHRPRQCRSSLQ
jgi:hypothetical protein